MCNDPVTFGGGIMITYGFLVEENMIDQKLFPLINSIHKDKKIISQMKIKQNEFSDEKVFSKIYEQLDLINNDKY